MNQPTTHNDEQDRAYFRCPVTTEKSRATVQLGRRKIKATVLEQSNGGYTIAVDKRYRGKLGNSKKAWLLAYDETKVLVSAEWVSEPEDGLVRIGLRQEKDLTKPEHIHTSLWSRFRPCVDATGSGSVVAYGGFVLVLFSVMAMPGLGENLGTSTRIQNAFRWFLNTASQQVDLWLG